ncbi:MAG: DUF4296 domain-containing protein [Bacteroidales bacterium]|nr:DUF4296 domain-containing protein [Bacteroidales bacterium]MDD4603443.1 DUF4296 domain-containing protein [Bacteroidales bacterium]
MKFVSRFLLIFGICGLLFSCGEPKTYREAAFAVVPSDSLIGQEQMIHLMADVHIVEAALVIKRNEEVVPKSQVQFYYDGIFNKYHISQKRYDDNLKYYRQDPQVFGKIYEAVVQELTKRQKNYTPVK